MIGWSDETTEIFATGLMADIYPIFRYIPTHAVRRLKQIFKEFNDYLGGILQEHRDTFDPGIDKLLKGLRGLVQCGSHPMSGQMATLSFNAKVDLADF